MARGWESKSVEEQQSQNLSSASPSKKHVRPEQAAKLKKMESLRLSRQRTLQQLQAACNPRHRAMLETALADLESQLRELEGAL